MKYLLYCIFEKPSDLTLVIPEAPTGHPLHMIEKDGLWAVFSEVSDSRKAYHISEIKTYHDVIESFFKQVTVVPFRFGTMLEEYADVERLLEKRVAHYKKMLSELEGCAEVGIRAIIDEDEIPIEGWCCTGFPSLESANPGKLYLSSRRVHYWTETLLTQISEKTAQRYREAFAGMYKKFRSETSNAAVAANPRRTVMVSLYFLLPRDLFPEFRQAFLDMDPKRRGKSMLTGPWPPYNFVLPDNQQTK